MAKSRKIPEAAAVRIRDLVVRELDAKYGPKDPVTGQRPKAGQRKICEDLDLSQPVLSDIENASGSIGVHALIALRNFLRKPIDDLLMLEPLPQQVAPGPSIPLTDVHRIVREAVVAGLEEKEQRRSSAPPAKGDPDAHRPRRR